MLNPFRNYYWYPPSETKIPWKAILGGFRNSHHGRFKEALCCYLKVDNCVLGNSARALLFTLLEALKRQDSNKRDEVLIPGYTCYSVAAAIAKAGLKISVYDMEPGTLHADIDSVEKAISEKTLAVVGQHLFGFFSPMDEIKKIANKYGAFLIEDAAQAFGNVTSGDVPGTVGDFGLLSFGRGKPLPVGGGGALISSRHQEIIESLSLNASGNGYRTIVVSALTQIVSKPALYWIPEMLPLGLGTTVFDPDFNVAGLCTMVEAIAAQALFDIERLNSHRRRIADVYAQNLPDALQVRSQGARTSVIRYPVLLPDNLISKEVMRLGVRQMYPNAIANERTIKPYLADDFQPTPRASEIAAALVTLPTHMGIRRPTADKIADLIKKRRQD